MFLCLLQNWDFHAPILVDISKIVNHNLEKWLVQEKGASMYLGWQRLIHGGPASDWEEIQSISGTGGRAMTRHTHHSLSLVTAYSMVFMSEERSHIGHCEPSWSICRDHTLEFVDGLCMHVCMWSVPYSWNILLWSCLSHVWASFSVFVSASVFTVYMCVNMCACVGVYVCVCI